MVKNSFISSFKKLPYCLIVSLVLFIFLEAAISSSGFFWRTLYNYSNPGIGDDAFRFEAQLKLMPTDDSTKKVFLTGSSQTREGFDIAILNDSLKKSNKTFYNLGVSGGAQPIDLFMCEKALYKNKPDTIIFGCFIGSFYDSYKFERMKYYFNPGIMPYLLKYIGIKELYRHKGCFIDSYIGEILPLYRYRESIGRLLLKIFSSYIRKIPPQNLRFRFTKNLSEDKLKTILKEINKDKYSITPYTKLNQLLLSEFAKNTLKKNINFIIIDIPTHPLIKECYNTDLDRQYNDFLKYVSLELGFIYLSREQLPIFTKDDFIDFTHLNSKGRKKLTLFLADYLKKSS